MNARKSIHSRYHKAPLRGATPRYRAGTHTAPPADRQPHNSNVSQLFAHHVEAIKTTLQSLEKSLTAAQKSSWQLQHSLPRRRCNAPLTPWKSSAPPPCAASGVALLQAAQNAHSAHFGRCRACSSIVRQPHRRRSSCWLSPLLCAPPSKRRLQRGHLDRPKRRVEGHHRGLRHGRPFSRSFAPFFLGERRPKQQHRRPPTADEYAYEYASCLVAVLFT